MDEMNGQMADGSNAGGYGMEEYAAAREQESAQQPQRPDQRQVLKAARRHFSKLGGMYLLGTIVTVVLQTAVAIVVMYLFPQWTVGDTGLLVSMLPMYLIGMPVLILLVRTVPAEKVERRRIRAGHFVIAVIMAFGAVYLTNIIGNIITAVIGVLKGSAVQNQLADVTESVSLGAIAFWMVLCAPIMEEYVFRKLIVDRTVRYGEGAAVLLSGLMFGLFHGNLNQFVYAFVLGMLLAFLYVKTGNLKITIAIHMLINLMGGLVTSALTRMIDLDEYMNIAADMDLAAMMEYISENMAGLLAYGALMIFMFGTLIAGLVLFIVSLAKKKFSFAKGQAAIPKGKRFRTIFLNAGMSLYVVFWIAMIIYSLVI